MAFSTIYTFFTGTQQIQVIRDNDDPTYISYNSLGPTGAPFNQPPEGTTMQVICSGYDQYTYKVKSTIPYATFTVIPNSGNCGYIPPACDIYVQSFVVTDETAPGANDGTVNMFAISSYGGIVYYLYGSGTGLIASNTTGYFTGLTPDTYTVDAIDANPCEVQGIGTVQPFDDTTLTHYKYRLQFESVNTFVQWELRFYDLLNNYLKTDYPKDVSGSGNPVTISQSNDDEDKASAIVSKNLSIELFYDGGIFTTDEFKNAPERQWYVELYKDGAIEFKGWLLPDEIQDYYQDPSYYFSLRATDGIPSLKGNIWGDGTGWNGYSTSQYQQYGLAKWSDLVKQCLDQLGYVYGNVTILSSLRFNNTYSTSLWNDIGTWSDILYDGDGNALDTYSALELLLKGMKLCIIQHKGKFVLVNWNDLYYALNPIKATEYNLAFYETDLVSLIGTSPVLPMYQPVGYNKPITPINPVQSLNQDKAYNIKTSIDFNLLALLYPDPGFEIGSTPGGLPYNMSKNGTIDAYLDDSQSYEGLYSLFVGGSSEFDVNNNILFDGGFDIDQPNKLLTVSLEWKPDFYSNDNNPAPTFSISFIDSTSTLYYYTREDGKWHLTPTTEFTVFDQTITDYLAWNGLTFSTAQFPGTSVGKLYISILPPLLVPDSSGHVPMPQGYRAVRYDNMELSLSDASEAYSKQIGETHTITAVTGIPQANVKDLDLKLFTFPPNKRVAGNVFSTTPYADGLVSNNWNFALKTNDTPDRLPATISKAFARTYQRPMYIFEGDFQCAYVGFYGIFTLEWYAGKIFMPYQVTLDCRNETGHIVIIEIDDSEAQNVYKYTPVYEKSSRRNY